MYKTIGDFKNKKDADTSKLFAKFKIFFALSPEQFAKGKAKYPEVKEWVNMFGGGICPKGQKKAFYEALSELTDKHIEEEKKAFSKERIICYHLANYESWYSHDITEALAICKDYGYTEEEVVEVFRNNVPNY